MHVDVPRALSLRAEGRSLRDVARTLGVGETVTKERAGSRTGSEYESIVAQFLGFGHADSRDVFDRILMGFEAALHLQLGNLIRD